MANDDNDSIDSSIHAHTEIPAGSVLTSTGSELAWTSINAGSTTSDIGTYVDSTTITVGDLTTGGTTGVSSDKFLVSSGGDATWGSMSVSIGDLTGPWKFEFLDNGDIKVVLTKENDEEVELHIEGSMLLELLMSKAHIIIGTEEEDD